MYWESAKDVLTRAAPRIPAVVRRSGIHGAHAVEDVKGDLKEFQTYFDLKSGSMRSTYITLEAVAAAARVEPAQLGRSA